MNSTQPEYFLWVSFSASQKPGHWLNWLHNLLRASLPSGFCCFGSVRVNPLTSVVCRRRFGYFSDKVNHDCAQGDVLGIEAVWNRFAEPCWDIKERFQTSAASNFMNEDVCSHQRNWEKETVSFFRALCVWHFNYPNDALTSGCRREAARASARRVRWDSSSSRPRRDREQFKNLLSYQNLQWLSRIFVISFWIIYDSMRTLKNRAVLFFCTNNNFLRFLSATAKNHSIRGLKFNSIWKLNDNFYKRRIFLHKHIKTIYFLTRCKCIKNTTPPFKSALFANWAVTQHRNEPKPVR